MRSFYHCTTSHTCSIHLLLIRKTFATRRTRANTQSNGSSSTCAKQQTIIPTDLQDASTQVVFSYHTTRHWFDAQDLKKMSYVLQGEQIHKMEENEWRATLLLQTQDSETDHQVHSNDMSQWQAARGRTGNKETNRKKTKKQIFKSLKSKDRG